MIDLNKLPLVAEYTVSGKKDSFLTVYLVAVIGKRTIE